MPGHPLIAVWLVPMLAVVFSTADAHKWLRVCAATNPPQLPSGDPPMNIDASLAEQMAASPGPPSRSRQSPSCRK